MVFCALAGALALTLAGCGETDSVPPAASPTPTFSPVPAETQPAAEFSFADLRRLQFRFSSGAGAWSTLLAVRPDGSFYGEYHDTDMESRTSVRCSGTANLPAGLPSRCR